MEAVTMRLWSDAFGENEAVPVKFTKDGYNTSPPFGWDGLPDGTRELALLFEGVTPATHEPWVHWLVYKIPADAEDLPSGFKHAREPEEPMHVLQGSNGLGNIGYDGPSGTVGRTYRYRIRLFALDRAMDLEPGLDWKTFERAIKGHVLDQAELHARYERPG
ncbi:MAG: YbhB/YbcL family Raf kinase inhibitor-like protein [Mesorhizobium sp.]|nr:MAG: YbhB/YbcL family Raf kinase inhibitor-like protein [Mesorhizobium sp.]